jgi:hypothetical protein
MRRAIGLCLSLLIAAPAFAAPETPFAHYQAVTAKTPGGCPGFGDLDLARLPQDAWTTPPPVLADHQALRAKTSAAPPPTAGQRLMILWSGGHHESVAGSVAVVRGADGAWRASGVDTYESWVPPPPLTTLKPAPLGQEAAPTPDPTPRRPSVSRREWVLSAGDSARMDALVASPCLEAEPRGVILHTRPYRLDGSQAFCVGGVVTTLEVFDARERRLASTQHCGRWGVAGQIVDLAFTSAPPR